MLVHTKMGLEVCNVEVVSDALVDRVIDSNCVL